MLLSNCFFLELTLHTNNNHYLFNSIRMETKIYVLTDLQLNTAIETAIETTLNRFRGLQPNVAPVENPIYLTRKETMNRLKISTATLWKYTKEGRLPSYRLGKKVKYLETDVMFCYSKVNVTPNNL